MNVIDLIRQKILDGDYEIAIPHFFDEMAEDDLDPIDVETAIGNGHVTRRFSKDVRGTRYEVVGNAIDGRLIGVICRIKESGKVLLITVYEIE
jgi:hypothetical protein